MTNDWQNYIMIYMFTFVYIIYMQNMELVH